MNLEFWFSLRLFTVCDELRYKPKLIEISVHVRESGVIVTILGILQILHSISTLDIGYKVCFYFHFDNAALLKFILNIMNLFYLFVVLVQQLSN